MVMIMMNVIKIHLKNKEDYMNTYNDEILSYELSNYILEELKGINTKKKIEFHISTDFEITEDDKDSFVWMIRSNFGADISEIINLSKKQRLTNYLISIVAIFFLVIYPLFKIEFMSEFALILAWVFLGEAICNFLYNSMENIYKINRRKQIVNAKVIFNN